MNGLISVLHFDDNTDHHELTKAMVGRLGHGIVFERLDSIEKATKQLDSGEYDCVLTDRLQPNDAGAKLFKMVRQKGNELPFIFLLDEGVDLEITGSDPDSNLYTELFAVYDALAELIITLAGQEERPASDPEYAGKIGQLTNREREILIHLAQGHSNKVIAQKLDISYKTVLNHVNNLYQKLGVNNRLEAAHLAIKVKLVEIE